VSMTRTIDRVEVITLIQQCDAGRRKNKPRSSRRPTAGSSGRRCAWTARMGTVADAIGSRPKPPKAVARSARPDASAAVDQP
jgi:hypothetical protein